MKENLNQNNENINTYIEDDKKILFDEKRGDHDIEIIISRAFMKEAPCPIPFRAKIDTKVIIPSFECKSNPIIFAYKIKKLHTVKIKVMVPTTILNCSLYEINYFSIEKDDHRPLYSAFEIIQNHIEDDGKIYRKERITESTIENQNREKDIRLADYLSVFAIKLATFADKNGYFEYKGSSISKYYQNIPPDYDFDKLCKKFLK